VFRPKPSGFLWLFAHEARLLWRGSILLRTRKHVVVPLVGVAIVFQAAALAIAWSAQGQKLSEPVLVMIANLNLVFLTFLMLSRAMTSAIDVLYSRGDVDFLLASPIPPSRVLAVRMFGVAGSTAAPWLLLGGVLANGMCVFGDVWALAIYPVIMGLALFAAALAFAIVVILVGWAGPRVARTLAHTLALTIGVAIFLLGQLPRYLPKGAMAHIWRSFEPSAGNAHSLLWVPGRALLGQPAPLAATLGTFLLVFLAVLFGLAPKFASGAITAAAFTPDAGHPKKDQFGSRPLPASIAKNLILLKRFPGLITQTAYRSLTLVPVALILSGRVTIGPGIQIVVPLIVFLAGQLALFFGSAIIASEQAPEFYIAAPVQAGLAARANGAAAFYAAMIVIAVPLLALAARSSALLPVALPFTIAAAATNLALAQSYPIPLTRAEFGKSQKGTVFGLILGVAVSSAWALAAYLILTPYPFHFTN